jgi:hypothetical protein
MTISPFHRESGSVSFQSKIESQKHLNKVNITYLRMADNLSPMSLNGRVTNITIKPIAKDLLNHLRDTSESKRKENQTTDMM